MEQTWPACGWLDLMRKCHVSCRNDALCAHAARGGGTYMSGHVTLYVSFSVAQHWPGL